MILPPRDPMRSGGGSVPEVLALLTTLGAAALAAAQILWRRPAPKKKRDRNAK